MILRIACIASLLSFCAACGDDDPATTPDASTDATSGDGASSADADTQDSTVSQDAKVSEDGAVADASQGDAQADAAVLPSATATISPTGETDATTSGTVTLVQDGSEVTITYTLANCPDGEHQTHIHAGTGCATRDDQGMHWGPTRGEGIPNLNCSGGTGTLSYTRTADNADTAWTIGDGEVSDVVGHPIVIHGLDNNDRIACGVIESPSI